MSLCPDPLAPMPLIPQPRPRWYPLIRPGPAAALEVVCLDSPHPVGTHFFRRDELHPDRCVTLPHTEPVQKCFGCRHQKSIRCYWYCFGWLLPVGRIVIAELTEHGADCLARDGHFARPFRGRVLRARRCGERSCGTVHATLLPRAVDHDTLPPCPGDLPGALRRIWGDPPLVYMEGYRHGGS